MKKDEFLQTLRRDLNGDVPPAVVEENIRYYDSYITEEVRKGRSEEEVIAEIGNPRLIAKNIEDTTDEVTEDAQYRESGYEENSSRSTYDNAKRSVHSFDLNKWYWKVLLIAGLFCIISLVFLVVGGIFRILSPILYPLLLIWLIMTLFRNTPRR